jgi:hypothetical protein
MPRHEKNASKCSNEFQRDLHNESNQNNMCIIQSTTTMETSYGEYHKSWVNMSRVIILSPYMEVIGPFARLEEQEGALFAKIAEHTVVLPIEMRETLSPHVGGRIAILRTDIPGKEYLVRVLSEPGLEHEVTPMTAQNTNADGKILNYAEVI